MIPLGCASVSVNTDAVDETAPATQQAGPHETKPNKEDVSGSKGTSSESVLEQSSQSEVAENDGLSSSLRNSLFRSWNIAEVTEAQPQLWAKRGDNFYAMETMGIGEKQNSSSPDGQYAIAGYSEPPNHTSINVEATGRTSDYAPVLKLNEGDELVTTLNAETVCVYPANWNGCFKYSDWKDTWTNGLDKLTSESRQYVEINGSKVDGSEKSAIQVLEQAGLYFDEASDDMYSQSPTTVEVGWYEGTRWETETLEWSQETIAVEIGSPIELPTTKTKEGYFLVDTTLLKPGSYVSFYSFGPNGFGFNVQ